MIRVLHIVGNMNKGGQETFIMNIYRNIDREKVQFDFIVHGPKGYYEDEILELGGEVYRVTPKTKNLYKYLSDMRSVFKENKFNVVHIHSGTATVFLDALIAKNSGVSNIIAHSHSTQSSNGAVLHKLCRPLLNRFVNYRFACSQSALEWLFGKQHISKQTIIKNSIDVSKYTYNSERRQTIRKNLGLTNELVIGHIGRFHPCKNHQLIVRVFKEVYNKNNNSVLILVGTGQLENEIKNQVKDLGIANNVKFLGLRDDVNDLLQAIDVLIFPSIYEGFPVTIVEAQAAGVPCVISKHLTQELDITPLLNRVDIDASIEIWTQEIFNQYMVNKPKDTSLDLINSGFDNKMNSEYIQNNIHSVQDENHNVN